MADKSNGYEDIAEAFTRVRTVSIGPSVVRKWAKGLRPGASVLDLASSGVGSALARQHDMSYAGRVQRVFD